MRIREAADEEGVLRVAGHCAGAAVHGAGGACLSFRFLAGPVTADRWAWTTVAGAGGACLSFRFLTDPVTADRRTWTTVSRAGGAPLTLFTAPVTTDRGALSAVGRAGYAAFISVARSVAAYPRTITAVLRTIIAGLSLGLLAGAISTQRGVAAVSAAEALHFSGADVVPLGYAAVLIQLADACLDDRVITATDITALTAVTLFNTVEAIFRTGGAIFTLLWGAVAVTADTRAGAAVVRAGQAVLTLVTLAVAANCRTGAAVSRTAPAMFAVLRSTELISAYARALTTVSRTIGAGLACVAGPVSATRDLKTISILAACPFRAEPATPPACIVAAFFQPFGPVTIRQAFLFTDGQGIAELIRVAAPAGVTTAVRAALFTLAFGKAGGRLTEIVHADVVTPANAAIHTAGEDAAALRLTFTGVR